MQLVNRFQLPPSGKMRCGFRLQSPQDVVVPSCGDPPRLAASFRVACPGILCASLMLFDAL
jgi:hypothetical protein